ncbi:MULTISPECIES: RraA family protein [unclassified Sphingobium]|uniref:RraA family protein n=1 Tax=unclassified Sphingobium TaxID=2611147 RepID=UPI0022250674|nr:MULTISPECIES: RraA family protein [unclassified Sphingobium]MCW2412689.1 regulator of RNase E activity RraA [Sphingobium sp. B8D3D]MCW2415013.1 regulator of RNase E activity RraA [Sphingobium sp. B8D3A]
MSAGYPYVARLRQLDACAVSDTLDKLGLAGCVTGLRSASPGRRIAGRVHTVKLKAGNAPADRPPVHLGAAAIDASGPDDVIVVEQRTGIDAGCWGGILSRGAQHRGVAGVICEGLARDVDEAREIGFPVFCRGYTARTARNRVYEDATDVPVTVGDFTVEPGFYVICDSSAAVFIAPADIARVLDAAEDIVRREGEMTRRLATGESASFVLGANYEYMLKGDQQ